MAIQGDEGLDSGQPSLTPPHPSHSMSISTVPSPVTTVPVVLREGTSLQPTEETKFLQMEHDVSGLSQRLTQLELTVRSLSGQNSPLWRTDGSSHVQTPDTDAVATGAARTGRRPLDSVEVATRTLPQDLFGAQELLLRMDERLSRLEQNRDERPPISLGYAMSGGDPTVGDTMSRGAIAETERGRAVDEEPTRSERLAEDLRRQLEGQRQLLEFEREQVQLEREQVQLEREQVQLERRHLEVERRQLQVANIGWRSHAVLRANKLSWQIYKVNLF